MNPRGFQQVAQELSQKGASAAALRSAISRAYYAVYHVAIELLAELGFFVARGPNAHGLVRHRLLNSGDTDVIHVGSELRELHTKRIQADYRLDQVEAERQALVESIVQNAKGMIRILDECRVEPRRDQIQKAIRLAERPPNDQP